MRVSEITGKKSPSDGPGKTKPDHWVDAIGSKFQNSWPSFSKPNLKAYLSVCYSSFHMDYALT
jgi:hypothetical protein